jgi:hypothetical protein
MDKPTSAEIRKFEQAKQKMGVAINHLSESIENMKEAFGPVIGPEIPCKTVEGKPPHAPMSDWSAYVQTVTEQIHAYATDISELCKRSEV